MQAREVQYKDIGPLTHGDMARQLESGSTLCEAAAVVHVLSYMQQ